MNRKVLALTAAMVAATLAAAGCGDKTASRNDPPTTVAEREYKPGHTKTGSKRVCQSYREGKCTSYRSVRTTRWVPSQWELDLADGREVTVSQENYDLCPEGLAYPACLRAEN